LECRSGISGCGRTTDWLRHYNDVLKNYSGRYDRSNRNPEKLVNVGSAVIWAAAEDSAVDGGIIIIRTFVTR